MSGHHPHTPDLHEPQDVTRQAITRRVALVGMAVNLFLTIAQIIGGIWAHSQALIADALHTLSDLIGDIVVLFASHHAAKDADEDHPYGHGRIETVATVVLGLLLAVVSAFIFYSAIERLLGHAPLVRPSPIAMGFAALAIIGKEALYQYTIYIAKRVQSPMLKASAWHHRSDAISSILVLIAIGGAQLGYPWLDAVAAILVAIMIFYMALQLILESTSELIDAGLAPDQVQEIRDYIHSLNGVESLHFLRTRRMGGQVLADVHLQVNGRISVSEGHYIGEAALYKLKNKFPMISDVVVHIDCEDDEAGSPSRNLPSRRRLLEQIHSLSETALVWPFVQDLTLHYINGKVSIDLFITGQIDKQALQAFLQASKQVQALSEVKCFQQYAP
jgi:cation diffusion facilitator family transporter